MFKINFDSTLENLDGIDLWSTLSENTSSKRTEALINIDNIWNSHGIVVGDYKVVKGTNYNGAWDSWYGPSGDREPNSYDLNNIHKSQAGKSLKSSEYLPSDEKIQELRKEATIDCSNMNKTVVCNPLVRPCLFNVVTDPCEKHNLADQYPTILHAILERLNYYNSTVVLPNNQKSDPRGDPRLWDYTWTNFDDYHLIQMESNNSTTVIQIE